MRLAMAEVSSEETSMSELQPSTVLPSLPLGAVLDLRGDDVVLADAIQWDIERTDQNTGESQVESVVTWRAGRYQLGDGDRLNMGAPACLAWDDPADPPSIPILGGAPEESVDLQFTLLRGQSGGRPALRLSFRTDVSTLSPDDLATLPESVDADDIQWALEFIKLE
jgi:hypothetical protein